MIDDDYVGVERGFSRLQDEAVAMKCTVASEAVLARLRDERPDGRILRYIASSRGRRRLLRASSIFGVTRVLARWQPAFCGRALEVVVADVIRTPFEECEGHRDAQRVPH